jgi:predicted acyl esterase
VTPDRGTPAALAAATHPRSPELRAGSNAIEAQVTNARAELPHVMGVLPHEWTQLCDGTCLAARIFLPADARRVPVPEILEYIPYRKHDATAQLTMRTPRATVTWRRTVPMLRGEWQTRIVTESTTTGDAQWFTVTDRLDAHEDSVRVFTKDWSSRHRRRQL